MTHLIDDFTFGNVQFLPISTKQKKRKKKKKKKKKQAMCIRVFQSDQIS